MIKPEFWEDDKIAECSPTARLLFVALWNFADDEGFLEYRIKWLKAKCLPYDDVSISDLLIELENAGRVIIQNNIIWVKNFLKHQKIDKPKPSELSQKFKDSTNVRRIVDDDSTLARVQEVKLKQDKLNQDKGSEDGEKISPSPTPSETMKDFCLSVSEKNERYLKLIATIAERWKIPVEKVSAEVDKFVNYWCELTRDGKKQRWQTEKTFEVQRRLVTWFSNANKFSTNRGTPEVANIR